MSETIQKRPDNLDREKRAQNAFRISIATGIIFALIVAGVMIINRSVRFDLSLLLVLSTAVAAFFSAWLSRRGKSDAGILLIIAGLLITIVGRVFVQKGLAIPTGVTNIILISTIATYALPRKWIGRVVTVSFITTIATIIIDQYTVGIPASTLPVAGFIISLVLGIIYLSVLAIRLWNSGRIQNRIIVIQSAVLIPIVATFAWYNVQAQSKELEQELIKKAESTAISGAATIGYLFEQAIANKELTTEQVFDTNYVPYWKFNPATYQFDGDPATLNKYHTAYDAYTDKHWQKLLDSFLNQSDFVYAVALDINGYIPTHNTSWSSWDGSPATDRSKRIFNDPVGIQAVRNTQPTLVQIYQRPGTNETLLDVSAPIYVNGKHWGGFRVGSVLVQNNLLAQSVVQSSTLRILLASIFLIIGLVATSALFLGQYVSAPLEKLTEEAARFSNGQFGELVEVPNRAEVTLLANAFNKMATQLSDTLITLEQRVAERTSEMEQIVKQSEKRASELQAIADISRHISTEKDVEKLLPLITHAVSEQFGFYHVGIFLLSENKRFALLRAANSTGGQVMLQRQHKLEVGQTGIVGNVTATGTPRIALDTGVDAVYFNNPDLPETHSEMALPLFVRGEVVGALDVQSTERNVFTPSDIFNLSLLADQIAIAIDNARLIEETQKALAESQSVFREYLAEAWQSKSASNVMGYYQTVAGGSVITKNTLSQADTLGSDKDILSIPIHLRGQEIGTLNILLGKEREELTADQINVVKSIVERLGLALENARLFEETSTRASRERLVTDITTKIRGTNNPQEMIKTAMEELKRALGASRVEVVPKKEISRQDK